MARILVVENDAFNIQILEPLLKALKHEVLLAGDGEQAVQQALQHRPDLLIVNAVLPRKDGFQVLDELRRFRRTQQTPILLLGRGDTAWDRDEARRRGASAFLKAPPDRQQVLETLSILLGK